MSIYEYHYGVSFGIYPINDTAPSPETQETINIMGYGTNGHSYRNFGLHPRSKPVISAPEIQKIEYEIPGRDGLYDATEALTGDVHFYNRTGTFEYTQTGGRKLWDATYHKLKNQLHGTKKAIILDEEPDGYYTGRLTVEEPTYDDKRGIAYFKITADLEPWKKSLTLSNQDWLWDPFSFEVGVINPNTGLTLIAEPGAASAVMWHIIGNRMPVVPHVFLHKYEKWDYSADGRDGKPHIKFKYQWADHDHNDHTRTIDLVEGDNVDQIPELVLRQGIAYDFEFWGVDGDPNGCGYVHVSYREGWL